MPKTNLEKAEVAGVTSNGQKTKKKREVVLVASSGQRWTTPQVAHFHQVSTRTVQEWRDKGRLEFVRVNARVIRYDADVVRAFVWK